MNGLRRSLLETIHIDTNEYFKNTQYYCAMLSTLIWGDPTSLYPRAQAGGDKRGLLSAAMLILHPDHAPLTLRIDHHEDPITQLDLLYQKVTSGDYYEWTKTVPTRNNPYRYK